MQNNKAYWELQCALGKPVVEKFTEWNIHYLLSSSHYLSNSAAQGKHCLVSNNIRQTHRPSVLGTFYRKAQDLSLCFRHSSCLWFPALCLPRQKGPWLAQNLPQSDCSKQMEKDKYFPRPMEFLLVSILFLCIFWWSWVL